MSVTRRRPNEPVDGSQKATVWQTQTRAVRKHLQLSNLRVIMIIKLNESLCGLGDVRPAEWRRARLEDWIWQENTYHVVVEHPGDVAAELRIRSERRLIHVSRFFVGAVNKQSGERHLATEGASLDYLKVKNGFELVLIIKEDG